MPSKFQPTRWSLIHDAAATDAIRRNRAWEEFDYLYREPLLRFICRSGWTRDRAEELLQSFLAKLADRDWLRDADPEIGKMRSFLLNRLKGHLGDARKHDHAQKRGGGKPDLSLEENEFHLAAEKADLEALFDREWAQSILDHTIATLQSEAEAKGRGEVFVLLKNQITGESEESIKRAAVRLGQTEGAVRMQLQRLREKFRDRLRSEVGETMLPGSDISAEMRYLAEVLSV
ncbi:MAG: hypothetical protein P1V20_18955 [Verrucomicrobiales bacterium]|nr:hypothetical protein [Verrucomicrobiales bacterium]